MKIIGIGIVLIVSVIVGGLFLKDSPSVPIGNTNDVLDLTLQDYEGNEILLSDFVGKPMILNSWAVWCPFCVKELSAFAEIQNEFGEEILIVAINRAESLDTAKGYTDDLGVTASMLFLLDPSDSFYRAISGFSMPETLFIDVHGVTQVHKRGPMEAKEIREKVQALFN